MTKSPNSDHSTQTITADDTARPSTSPLLVLALSVLGLSFAAPLVRLSTAPALVIATWRLAFSLIIVGVALLATGGWRKWRAVATGDLLLSCVGGILLALHFWSWNASLSYTSVAASVSLVNLQPAFVAFISWQLLREVPRPRQSVGILIAMIGAFVVGFADVPGGFAGIGSALTAGAANSAGSASGRALYGDFLALIGAATAAAYYLIGRRVRQKLDLWPYVGLVYGAAFVTLLALVWLTKSPLFPQPTREFAIFGALAVGPMLLGHTGMNWALGHLPAYVVNLTVLGEPIGATLLAAIIPGIGEVPAPGVLIGGAIVLLGVYLTARK
ncbi:MAG: DMT family transporter [Gemmatimonadaceae bacterium]